MLFGEATKGPRIETFLDVFRGSAKDLGEWSLWIFVAMVLVALWQRFPYHLWRYVHKALAVFYLIIVFHSIVLTPAQWWLQPTGMLIALASVLGTYAALVSLSGRIGRSRTHSGKLLEVRHLQSGMVELVCQLDSRWLTSGLREFAQLHRQHCRELHSCPGAAAHQWPIFGPDSAPG